MRLEHQGAKCAGITNSAPCLYRLRSCPTFSCRVESPNEWPRHYMSFVCGRIPLELHERLAGGLVITVSEATGDYGEATNDGKKDGAGLELVLGSGMTQLVYSEIIQLRLAVGFLGGRNTREVRRVVTRRCV